MAVIDFLKNGNTYIYPITTTTAVYRLDGTVLDTWMNNHTHTKSQITDLGTVFNTNGFSSTFHWEGVGGQPSWLLGSNSQDHIYVYNPSNFNVDAVDGAHGWQWQTVSQNWNSHGLAHMIVCQHNVNGDNRFFIHKEDNGHEISVHHSLYSNNSGGLSGLAWNQYVTGPFWGGSIAGLFSSSNPDHAAIGDVSPEEGTTPTGQWCHFITMPHRSMGEHTAQIIVPFFNNPRMYVRTAPGGVPGNLGVMAEVYTNYWCHACLISAGAPGRGDLLWAW